MSIELHSADSQASANWASAFCASRVWTAELLGRACFNHCRRPARAAAASLKRQVDVGLLNSTLLDCCPPPAVARPLYAGPPNREPESYGTLAYLAEQRRSVAARPLRVYWATSRFARLYGSWTGEDALSRPELVSHDLLLAAVWLVYLRQHRDVALHHWKSERQLQREHRRGHRLTSIPDALITTPRRTTAVEVLGHYPADWIAHHCRGFRQAGWYIVLW